MSLLSSSPDLPFQRQWNLLQVWCRGAILLTKIVLEVFKRLSVSPNRMVLHLLCLEVQVLLHQQRRRPKSSWSSSQPQGEASRCPSRHEGIKGFLCHPLLGGFSGVQETSFNIQSCSYQVQKLLLNCHFVTYHKCHTKGGIQPYSSFSHNSLRQEEDTTSPFFKLVPRKAIV